MKPTTEQIINWGREALNKTGALIPKEWNMELLEAICSAAYEAGRKDENEACAKVCEAECIGFANDDEQLNRIAAAIRARGRND